MMTSISSLEYAHLDFAPKATFTDVSRVCWDMNQTDMGQRKWVQVVVVPAADVAAHGGELRYIQPFFDVAGTDFWNGQQLPPTGFMLSMLEGSVTNFVGQNQTGQNLDGFRVGDKARRYHHCMTDLGNGTIRYELERQFPDGSPWPLVRDLPGRFPDGQVRVIFQDVTYDNLDKSQSCRQSSLNVSGNSVGCSAPNQVHVDPTVDNTWHWDNIAVY